MHYGLRSMRYGLLSMHYGLLSWHYGILWAIVAFHFFGYLAFQAAGLMELASGQQLTSRCQGNGEGLQTKQGARTV